MPFRPGSKLAVIAAATCAATAIAVPDAATTAAAATTSTPRATMLVFLRPTVSVTSRTARALVASAQDDVATLAASFGSRVLHRTSVPDTLTLSLTTAQAHELSADPLVDEVLPNATIPGPVNPAAGSLGSIVGGTRGAVAHPSCGTAKHPQLNPEGLANIDDVHNANRGFDGKGIVVAFLADGLAANDPDLVRNAVYASAGSPKGSRVIESYQDFSGDGIATPTDGAEAFGDAGSIAAQGNEVYDLSRYVSRAHRLPKGCDATIVGSAPGATLLALKIFAQDDTTTGSGYVQAINYAVAHGASVINESFGGNPFPDSGVDIIRAADEAAVAAGVTVVASSGDGGVNGSIGSPSTDPDVLSVGATTTFRAYAQDTYGGINIPGASGTYLDNNISSLSSGGFAQDGKTVNLVAPGDLGWSLCSANVKMYSGCTGMNLQLFGGTSEAAPLTSGAAADVIEAYEASHSGAKPTPQLVMQILTSSAHDIAAPADEQGAGLLDVGAAVRLALSIPGTTISKHPGGILADTSQVNLSGLPSAPVSSSISLTNTSTSNATVSLSTRALVPAGAIGGRIVLNPDESSKTPRFAVWSGATEIYRKVTFHVRSGLARLELRAAYQYEGQTSLLHIALFDPNGQFAGYSLPQGIGDYADVEVARPQAGTWTAAFFTVWDGWRPSDFGTSGPVPFTVSFWRFASFGSVGPGTVSIPAGATTSFDYDATLPSVPGDSDVAIVVSTKLGTTTIPVTLRTFVALGPSGGEFSGELTGGNGRDGAPGQTNTYDFTVPAGENDLDVAVALASNPSAGELPGVQLIGVLLDPSGQTVAYDSNYTASQTQVYVDKSIELYAADPVAGDWQLVLDWVQPGAGTKIEIPFRGSIEFDQVSALGDLPDAASTTVPKTGETFDVTVHNTGVAPMLVAPDARLDETTTLTLPDFADAAATQRLPDASNNYFLPPETTSVTFTVTATVEATFDVNAAAGDPDLSPTSPQPYETGSLSPSEATLTYAPPSGVTPGMWGLTQAEVGPYPAKGEPSATETTTTSVLTQAFDPTVTSTVPDTVKSLALGGSVNPDFLAVGASTTIPITITPTGSAGTTVTGVLYIAGFTTGSYFGNTIVQEPSFVSMLAAIPYEYKVG
jgi:hypothetical protein